MMKMTTSPGGRKLKQARLNFGSPQPSPPKKPRLEKIDLGNEKEANKTEPSKNSPVTPIVLSDNEVEEHVEPVEPKLFNPYVSLVDIALKRKRKRKDISQKKLKSENSSSEECHEECSTSGAINHENALKPIVMIDKKSDSDKVDSHKEISSVDDDEQVTIIPVSKECSHDKLNDAANPKSIVNDNVKVLSSHTDEDIIEIESPAQQDVIKSCDEKDSSDASESESELELSKVESHDDNESQDENDESDTANVGKCEPSPSKSSNKEGNDLVPKTPTSARKLTPSQMKKKLESAKKQQEREKEKMIRDRKKEVEKAEKAKLKQEKEEQRKKEKEEKEKAKELEKRERELKERLRQIDKEVKQKKKEAKEEEKKKSEEAFIEEKRRKEMEKEKMENKKKKTAAAFINFFVPKEKNSRENQSMDNSKHNYLSNFTVKSDMRLAPIIRYQLNSESKSFLDKHLENQNSKKQSLYIMLLKSKQVESKSSIKTWPLEEMKNDLIIIEDDLPPVDDVKENEVIVAEHQAKTMKPKLLGFADNRRPPYWGTWSRKSLLVTGRRPFAMDKTHLDYDCDSDDEWEEEEPGESVESIAGSDDDEDENEYDVDNDFMVPHGYLSDEEVLGEDDNALSPETHKAKLKFLENEFEDEMKKPTKHKKARLIGIIWQSSIGGQPSLCPSAVWDFLSQRSILSSEPKIDIQISDENNAEIDDGEKSTVRKIRKISDEMVPVLIKLVHGNTNNRGFLANEFQAYIAKSSGVDTNAENALEEKRNNDTISKTAIAKKIKEISTWMPCPEEGPMQSRMCWFVEKEIREKYNQSDLNLPNEWSYVLMPKRRMDVPKKEKCKSPSTKQSSDVKALKESPSTKKENAFNITKFTKKMTQEEREKQFVSNPSTVLSPSQPTKTSETSNTKPEKKRVALLLSGPRGKDLNSPNASQNTKQSNVDNAQKITPNEKSVNIQQVKEKTETSNTKKKVSLLASGPRGKDLVKSSKTNLLTHFIQTASGKDKHSSETESKMDTDSDLIVLSD